MASPAMPIPERSLIKGSNDKDERHAVAVPSIEAA